MSDHGRQIAAQVRIQRQRPAEFAQVLVRRFRQFRGMRVHDALEPGRTPVLEALDLLDQPGAGAVPHVGDAGLLVRQEVRDQIGPGRPEQGTAGFRRHRTDPVDDRGERVIGDPDPHHGDHRPSAANGNLWPLRTNPMPSAHRTDLEYASSSVG